MADLPLNVSTTQAPPVKPKNLTTAQYLALDFGGTTPTYWIVDAPDSLGGRHLTDGKATRYLVVTGSGKKISYQTVPTIEIARQKYIDSYAKSGGIQTLRKSLLNSGYMSQRAFDQNVDFIPYLDEAIRQSTIANVQSYVYEGKTEFTPLTSYLTAKDTGAGSGKPTTYKVITTRGEARAQLNSYFNDLKGSNASEAEQDAYYNKLHTAENKATMVSNNGTQTGSVLEDADRLMLAVEVGRKSLAGTDVDALLKAPKGSRVAVDISKLQALASQYAIDMPATEALKYVIAGLGQKDYLEKQAERLKQVAIQLHPALKEHLLAGGTVEDIANQYANAKARKLGVVIKTPTQDKDVMDAVTKGETLGDFNIRMQSKPEWKLTPEAHETGADFANTILQSFGFMGQMMPSRDSQIDAALAKAGSKYAPKPGKAKTSATGFDLGGGNSVIAGVNPSGVVVKGTTKKPVGDTTDNEPFVVGGQNSVVAGVNTRGKAWVWNGTEWVKPPMPTDGAEYDWDDNNGWTIKKKPVGNGGKTVVSRVDNGDGTFTVTWSDGSVTTEGTKVEKDKKPEIDSATKDAFAMLKNLFATYGLEDLAGEIKGYMTSGLTANEALIKLKTNPKGSYAARFAGNFARVKAGFNAISEAEYIDLESSYAQTLRSYGLGNMLSVDRKANWNMFAKYIENDISAVEFKERIDTVQKRVVNADPATKDLFKKWYPSITDSDLVSYFLDPTRTIDKLKAKTTAAEIGSAFVGQGLLTDQASAEGYATYGIDRAGALQGAANIAEILPETTKLGDIYGETGIKYSQKTAEEEFLKADANAARKRNILASKERASFSGSAGFGKGSASTGYLNNSSLSGQR